MHANVVCNCSGIPRKLSLSNGHYYNWQPASHIATSVLTSPTGSKCDSAATGNQTKGRASAAAKPSGQQLTLVDPHPVGIKPHDEAGAVVPLLLAPHPDAVANQLPALQNHLAPCHGQGQLCLPLEKAAAINQWRL